MATFDGVDYVYELGNTGNLKYAYEQDMVEKDVFKDAYPEKIYALRKIENILLKARGEFGQKSEQQSQQEERKPRLIKKGRTDYENVYQNMTDSEYEEWKKNQGSVLDYISNVVNNEEISQDYKDALSKLGEQRIEKCNG